MKVYLMTAVDTSYVHELDSEQVLRTGNVYATLEAAKAAAQEYANEENDNYNEFGNGEDEPRPATNLTWEQFNDEWWSVNSSDDEAAYCTDFLIREIQL